MNKELNSIGINKKPEDTTVVVAMSGGVDSSTVAGIMKNEGYKVIGITLKLYDDGKEVAASKQCCSGQDIMDAKRVANKLGIERREVKDSEIEERCMYALVNEGARILEEEISYRSSDIDVIWHYGYGFPRLRGGPMYMADKIGLSNIHATMLKYKTEYGDNWEPAKLLTELSDVNGSFSDWSPG